MPFVPGRMKSPFFKSRNNGLLKYLRRLCGNDTDYIYPTVSGDHKPCDNPSLDSMPSGIRRISGLHLSHDPRLHIHGCQAHPTVFAHAPPRADRGSLSAPAAGPTPAAAGRMDHETSVEKDKDDEGDCMERHGQEPSQPCAARGTRGVLPLGQNRRHVRHSRYASALEPAFLLGEQATAARKSRLDTRTMDAPAGTSSFQAMSRPPSQETTPNRAARKKRRPRR